jgi:hypothetical protein
MAPVTPTGVPGQVVAGDTLVFELSYGDYPISEGWVLSMSFVGKGALQTETAEVTEDDAKWTVLIPATRTAILHSNPGAYRWFAYMTGAGAYAGQKYTVAEGRIEVLANPRQAQDGDFQAQCEKDLAVVEAAIAGRLADDMQAYTIRGRQVVMIPVKELVAERSRLKREVWRFRNPGAAMPVLRRVYHGPR